MGLVKALGLAGVGALILTACSGEKNGDNTEVATPEVQPLAVNCNDASIKNRLVREVQMIIDEQAIAQSKEIKDFEEVGLERRLGQRLTELALDLQNASLVDGEENLCQADLQFLFTSDDVKYYAYTVNGEEDALQTLLEKYSLELTADNRVSVPIRYQVDGMTVKLDSTPESFQDLAYVLTASAYGAASDSSSLDLSGRKAPTITPVEPIEPTVIPRTDVRSTDESDDSDKSDEDRPSQRNQADEGAANQKPAPTSKTNAADRATGEREQSTRSNTRDSGPAADKPATTQGPAARNQSQPTQGSATRSQSTQQGPAASRNTGSATGPAARAPKTEEPRSEELKTREPKTEEPRSQELKPESMRVTESEEVY